MTLTPQETQRLVDAQFARQAMLRILGHRLDPGKEAVTLRAVARQVESLVTELRTEIAQRRVDDLKAEAATLAATSPYRTIRLGREVLGGKGDASRPIGWATDATVTIRIDGLGGFYEQP